MNKIAIKVGANQILSEMVQKFLFDKGFEWGSSGRTVINIDYRERSCISFSSKLLGYSPLEFYVRNDYQIIDAATEFGKLVELFNKKPAPPETIELCNVKIHSNGVVEFAGHTSFFWGSLNEIVAKRDELMKQWADYPKNP